MYSSLFSLTVVLFLLYRYAIYPVFLSPLSKIPNAHFSVPFSSLWIQYKRRNGGTGIHAILPAHRRLGPVIRISLGELSVASLDGLRQIYGGGFEKTQWYADEFMNYKTPNLVSMLGSRPHSTQKRMLSHVYSKSYVQNSYDLQVLSNVLLFDRLLPLLQAAVDHGALVDIYELNQALGADFMSAYLFGLENCTDFIRDLSMRKKHLRNIRLKMKGLPGHDKATEELEAYVFSLCQVTENQLQIEEGSTRPVVYSQLSSHLSNRSPSQSNSIPSQPSLAVASEILDHLIAGEAAAKITLTYLFWELSRRPALQSALRNELLTLAPPPIYTSPQSDGAKRQMPNLQAIDGLPLLHAVLQETLRLYPLSMAPLPRVVPPGGTVIDGYTIPAETVVGTSAYCMHRNEEAWYNASEWRPERWLQEGGKGIDEGKRWFWAFGSGGRMCLGSHFTMCGVFCLSLYL
jgi:Cytochrome P450